ncbi:MAG TPA: hypothetical protein VF516_03350 [Kofleriaceae bacterium]
MGAVFERELDVDPDAYGDEKMLTEAFDAADALRAHEEAAAKRQPAPIPQPCHECGHHYAGISCQICKTERPAWTALKNMGAMRKVA